MSSLLEQYLVAIEHRDSSVECLRRHAFGNLGELRVAAVRLDKISIYSILALTTEASCIMSMAVSYTHLTLPTNREV